MIQVQGEAHIQKKEADIPPLPEGSPILFPQGLVGFQDLKNFFLRPLTGDLGALVRIESEDQPGIGFYLLPLPVPTAFYAEQDVAQTLESFGLQQESGLFFLIITALREEGELILTANVRAPIVVNVVERQAWQYVLLNQQYEISQEIARLKLSVTSGEDA